MGAVSAAGIGVDALWQAARDGISQISTLPTLRHGESLRIKVGGTVRDFEPTMYLSEQTLKRCDRFTQFAHVAVEEALRQAAIDPDVLKGQRTAIVLGTGIGGGTTIEEGCYTFYTGTGRADELTVPRLMPQRGGVPCQHHPWRHGALLHRQQRLFLGEPGHRHCHAADSRGYRRSGNHGGKRGLHHSRFGQGMGDVAGAEPG